MEREVFIRQHGPKFQRSINNLTDEQQNIVYEYTIKMGFPDTDSGEYSIFSTKGMEYENLKQLWEFILQFKNG